MSETEDKRLYFDKMNALLGARARGPLSDEEEAERTTELDDHWWKMTDAEREEAERVFGGTVFWVLGKRAKRGEDAAAKVRAACVVGAALGMWFGGVLGGFYGMLMGGVAGAVIVALASMIPAAWKF